MLYTGGFVNWLGINQVLAFKYMITSEEKGQRLQKSAASAYPVIDMLIKKNAPVYNKYRSQDNSFVYVESVCLNPFIMRCQVIMGNGESVMKNYQIPIGKIVQINIRA